MMRELAFLFSCFLVTLCSCDGLSIESTTRTSKVGSCVVDFDGIASDLPKIHPILVDEQGEWILPSQSAETGHSVIEIPAGAEVYFSCPFTGFQHEDIFLYFLSARCDGNSQFTLTFTGETYNYNQLGCLQYPEDFAVPSTSEKCGPNNDKTLITVSYSTGLLEKGLYVTCLDEDTSNSIFSHHLLYEAIGERETGSDGMPDFSPDDFYPSFDVNDAYTKVSQHGLIAQLLGSQELADKYVDLDGGCRFLARGHLAPRADFIYKNWQRSSYRFINVAPQWQCFNQYNWNYLETAVRSFFEKREVNPFIEIFTGTSGVLELNDVNDNPTEIWLNFDGKQRLAVPKYFWKIVYDSETLLGVVLIGVNNIYLSEDEIMSVKICPEIVNQSFISEINNPDDIYRGVVYACSYQDASEVIPELPVLQVSGILD